MERILVADDSALMRAAVREIVESEDFAVVGEAAHGREAVERFERLRPDVVLLDLVMPELSGVDALREIRRLDRNVPVVVCAGLGQEPLAAEAVLAGANDFVVKPFQPFGLLATLWRLRRKRPTPARAA